MYLLRVIVCFILTFLLKYSAVLHAQTFTISGYVYDKATGESLIGVTIQDRAAQRGTSTNEYGFYSLSLPAGTRTLVFTYPGFEPTEQTTLLRQNHTLNVRIAEQQNTLGEVVIKAEAQREREVVQNSEMGRLSVPMEILRRTPALFGESDLIKALQLMPGVKRGGEGTTGMFVRGGGNDENLVLLDEAPVYNVGHILGFLSVFNSPSIKSVDLYKGAFPAQYGGRLSSILDVRMREGSDQRFGMQGSIGNIAANLTVEAPIVRDRASFIVSGRRSYLDKIVSLVQPGLFPYYFYDFNAKVNYKITERDRLYLSSYFGRDVLSASQKSDSSNTNLGISSNLGNFTITARWNHIYRAGKMFHNLTLLKSQFRYQIEGKAFENSVFIRSAIDDIGLKMDFDYRPSGTSVTYKFGGQITNHLFRPNLVSVQGEVSDVLKSKKPPSIYNQEMGLYGSADRDLGTNWKLNAGVRLSASTVQGAFYTHLEPRFSARYALSDRHSLKVGYARMVQYLHLVSSSSVALPTDLWYPTTKNVLPGKSDQVSAGWFTWLGNASKIQLSTEVYYKKLHQLIEYREGARLLLNDNYENELVRGQGEAYGWEILAQKNTGKLNGWIGYTLAWSTRTFPDVNQGARYYARYDRRHDVSVVANYDFSRRFGVSLAWVYSTGNPFTPIVAKLLMPFPNYSGVDLLPVYPAKNTYRLHDAHRLDIDFVLRGKKRRRWAGEWHLGAYNVYNRAQPNRVVLVLDEKTGREKYQERGLFGIIGSLSYQFKF